MSDPKTKLWARLDLNQGPTDYESAALTAELRARCKVSQAPATPALLVSRFQIFFDEFLEDVGVDGFRNVG